VVLIDEICFCDICNRDSHANVMRVKVWLAAELVMIIRTCCGPWINGHWPMLQPNAIEERARLVTAFRRDRSLRLLCLEADASELSECGQLSGGFDKAK
jgi:hypothetical protein